jgi:cyclopropane-fatty-acyl-phospholipid synthase
MTLGFQESGARGCSAEVWRRGGAVGAGPFAYAIICANGVSLVKGDSPPAFTFFVKDAAQFDWLLRTDAYSAALSFVRGDFEIQGDLIDAIRFKSATTRHGLSTLLASIAARFAPGRVESRFQTVRKAAKNVHFHYDRSNDFYRAFLDPRMVYSCAYFADPNQGIEEAQLAKLDHICRKLDLHPGERFADIGCGWGALVIHAAEKYGAVALGCTLSSQQEGFARTITAEKCIGHQAMVRKLDYRQLRGSFQKIASVGMFEHVWRHRLRNYFRAVFNMLEDDGLFLNHGIIRPEGVRDGPETLFLQRRVFPGGELAYLSIVIREAERAGFEVLDVENLRPHYALTCRHWVERMQRNAQACLREASAETYRTWLLYLAGSAVSFERGLTDVYQILLAKRRSRVRYLTREYMYRGVSSGV